jgi:hypothetical protein
MALATYTDLQAAVASWLHRTDLTSVIPDFIALAESRISRDLRIRKQVLSTTLATVAGTQTVALPSDLLEIENIGVSSSNPARQLHYITPEIMDEKFPNGYYTDIPTAYTILGDSLVLGPTPDAVYTLAIDYYQKLTALSTTPTNWLLTNHPGIYLWGALAEAAPWIADEQQIAIYERKYAGEVKMLQDTDDTAVRSGSTMRVRAL